MSDSTFTLTPLTDKDIINLAKGKEVLNNKDLSLNFEQDTPERGGLYDPAIFGMAKRCFCSVTRLKTGDPPKVCPSCKTLVFSSSDEWKNNLAFYRLSVPFIFPYKIQKFKKLLNEMGIYCVYKPDLASKQWYDDLYSFWNTSFKVTKTKNRDDAFLVKDDQFYKLTVAEVDIATETSIIGLSGLYELQAYKLVDGRTIDFSQYLNTCLPITSTYFRRYNVLHVPKPKLSVDEATLNYKAIIELNMLLSRYTDFIDTSIDYATMLYNLNMLISKITYDVNILRGGKFHTTRDNLRQRVNRSFRANIIPALDIDMNHIKVPESLAYTALNEDVIHKLMDEEKMDRFEAVSAYKQKSVEAMKAFHELVDMSMVVFLRQPILHKYGMVALHPIISDKTAIEIPIDLCVPLNADFDKISVA